MGVELFLELLPVGVATSDTLRESACDAARLSVVVSAGVMGPLITATVELSANTVLLTLYAELEKVYEAVAPSKLVKLVAVCGESVDAAALLDLSTAKVELNEVLLAVISALVVASALVVGSKLVAGVALSLASAEEDAVAAVSVISCDQTSLLAAHLYGFGSSRPKGSRDPSAPLCCISHIILSDEVVYQVMTLYFEVSRSHPFAV